VRWPGDPISTDVLAGVLGQSAGRSLPIDEYWQRLRPHLRALGISRVADITGLDHIGFPVVQAVRPNARSNAVTQGKASTITGAGIGAVLECLEMAAGEDLHRLPTVPAQDAPLWRSFAPGLPHGTEWPVADTQYTRCREVVSDTGAALPRDLISTDFRHDAPAASAPILRHSIGLGAGPSLAAALRHGLLECIEADARIRLEHGGRSHRLSLSLDHPDHGAVLRQITSAGLRALVEDMPCQGGVVAVKASVMEAPGATTLPLPATGYGARETCGAAIHAALAEALQARLAVISGAREDITQRFYVHGFSQEELAAEWARHDQTPFAKASVDPVPVTLRQIAEAVAPVYAVPLFWDAGLPLAIIRVVAPKLIADPLRLSIP